VTVERLCHLNNRGEKKCHGQILAEIYDLITELTVDVAVFVREKGFSRFPHETQALFKVVGVSDLAAWKAYGTEFVEIAPTTVKKLLTGSGKANKDEVAAALDKYIGEQQFEADDESDAAAVGIAWLIRNSYIKTEEGREQN
jgi:crossover junction endodeoxyribonuclease RuvC